MDNEKINENLSEMDVGPQLQQTSLTITSSESSTSASQPPPPPPQQHCDISSDDHKSINIDTDQNVDTTKNSNSITNLDNEVNSSAAAAPATIKDLDNDEQVPSSSTTSNDETVNLNNNQIKDIDSSTALDEVQSLSGGDSATETTSTDISTTTTASSFKNNNNSSESSRDDDGGIDLITSNNVDLEKNESCSNSNNNTLQSNLIETNSNVGTKNEIINQTNEKCDSSELVVNENLDAITKGNSINDDVSDGDDNNMKLLPLSNENNKIIAKNNYVTNGCNSSSNISSCSNSNNNNNNDNRNDGAIVESNQKIDLLENVETEKTCLPDIRNDQNKFWNIDKAESNSISTKTLTKLDEVVGTAKPNVNNSVEMSTTTKSYDELRLPTTSSHLEATTSNCMLNNSNSTKSIENKLVIDSNISDKGGGDSRENNDLSFQKSTDDTTTKLNNQNRDINYSTDKLSTETNCDEIGTKTILDKTTDKDNNTTRQLENQLLIKDNEMGSKQILNSISRQNSSSNSSFSSISGCNSDIMHHEIHTEKQPHHSSNVPAHLPQPNKYVHSNSSSKNTNSVIQPIIKQNNYQDHYNNHQWNIENSAGYSSHPNPAMITDKASSTNNINKSIDFTNGPTSNTNQSDKIRNHNDSYAAYLNATMNTSTSLTDLRKVIPNDPHNIAAYSTSTSHLASSASNSTYPRSNQSPYQSTLDLSKPTNNHLPATKTNSLYIKNPDFTKHQQTKTRDLSPLRMKAPDFSKISQAYSTNDLKVTNPHFSAVNYSNNESSSKPVTLPTAVNPSNFAEISKRRNYISDLQLKNPTPLTQSNKVESSKSLEANSTYNNLYVKGPDFTKQNKIDENYGNKVNHELEEPTAHVIHKSQFINHTSKEVSSKVLTQPPSNQLPAPAAAAAAAPLTLPSEASIIYKNYPQISQDVTMSIVAPDHHQSHNQQPIQQHPSQLQKPQKYHQQPPKQSQQTLPPMNHYQTPPPPQPQPQAPTPDMRNLHRSTDFNESYKLRHDYRPTPTHPYAYNNLLQPSEQPYPSSSSHYKEHEMPDKYKDRLGYQREPPPPLTKEPPSRIPPTFGQQKSPEERMKNNVPTIVSPVLTKATTKSIPENYVKQNSSYVPRNENPGTYYETSTTKPTSHYPQYPPQQHRSDPSRAHYDSQARTRHPAEMVNSQYHAQYMAHQQQLHQQNQPHPQQQQQLHPQQQQHQPIVQSSKIVRPSNQASPMAAPSSRPLRSPSTITSSQSKQYESGGQMNPPQNWPSSRATTQSPISLSSSPQSISQTSRISQSPVGASPSPQHYHQSSHPHSAVPPQSPTGYSYTSPHQTPSPSSFNNSTPTAPSPVPFKHSPSPSYYPMNQSSQPPAAATGATSTIVATAQQPPNHHYYPHPGYNYPIKMEPTNSQYHPNSYNIKSDREAYYASKPPSTNKKAPFDYVDLTKTPQPADVPPMPPSQHVQSQLHAAERYPQKYASTNDLTITQPQRHESSSIIKHASAAANEVAARNEKPSYAQKQQKTIFDPYMYRRTSETDLNYQIIKKTLNKDVSIRRSDADLSCSIFDNPKVNQPKESSSYPSGSESFYPPRGGYPANYQPNYPTDQHLAQQQHQKQRASEEENLKLAARKTEELRYQQFQASRSTVPDKSSGTVDARRPHVPYDHYVNRSVSELSKHDLSVTVSRISASMGKQEPSIEQARMQQSETTIPIPVNYPSTTQKPHSKAAKVKEPKNATVKSALPIGKRESPLDLSVKTVKTKADSTGCGDYSLPSTSRYREQYAPAASIPPQSLKVDFAPNFQKHASRVSDSKKAGNHSQRSPLLPDNQQRNNSYYPPSMQQQYLPDQQHPVRPDQKSYPNNSVYDRKSDVRHQPVAAPQPVAPSRQMPLSHPPPQPQQLPTDMPRSSQYNHEMYRQQETHKSLELHPRVPTVFGRKPEELKNFPINQNMREFIPPPGASIGSAESRRPYEDLPKINNEIASKPKYKSSAEPNITVHQKGSYEYTKMLDKQLNYAESSRIKSTESTSYAAHQSARPSDNRHDKMESNHKPSQNYEQSYSANRSQYYEQQYMDERKQIQKPCHTVEQPSQAYFQKINSNYIKPNEEVVAKPAAYPDNYMQNAPRKRSADEVIESFPSKVRKESKPPVQTRPYYPDYSAYNPHGPAPAEHKYDKYDQQSLAKEAHHLKQPNEVANSRENYEMERQRFKEQAYKDKRYEPANHVVNDRQYYAPPGEYPMKIQEETYAYQNAKKDSTHYSQPPALSQPPTQPDARVYYSESKPYHQQVSPQVPKSTEQQQQQQQQQQQHDKYNTDSYQTYRNEVNQYYPHPNHPYNYRPNASTELTQQNPQQQWYPPPPQPIATKQLDHRPPHNQHPPPQQQYYRPSELQYQRMPEHNETALKAVESVPTSVPPPTSSTLPKSNFRQVSQMLNETPQSKPSPPQQRTNNVVHKGVDQSVISKLRTNLELKEMEKQKALKSQSSTETIEDDGQKSDIASIIAARIRTKGELKGYTPIPEPATFETKTIEQEGKSIDTETEQPAPPAQMDVFSDLENNSSSALDLMDWGSACNDFVEQLQTGGSKKRGGRKKRAGFKSLSGSVVDFNKLEAVEPEIPLQNLPGIDYKCDMDESIVNIVKAENQNVFIMDESEDANVVPSKTAPPDSSSSDEDTPLVLLRQQSLSDNLKTKIDTEKPAEIKTAAEQHEKSDTSQSTSRQERMAILERLSEKISKNKKEQQREKREIEKKLTLHTSSDSDGEINRFNKRPKKIIRKPRTRASVGLKNTSDDDSSDMEDDEKRHKVILKNGADAKKRKKSDNSSTSDSEPLQNQRKFTKTEIPALRSDTEEENTDMPTTETAKQTIETKSAVKKSTIETASDNSEDDDNKKTPPKSKSQTKIEETMTRSKKKREIANQIANSKVLRSDKVIKNVQEKSKKLSFSEKTPVKSATVLKSEDSKKKAAAANVDSDEGNTTKTDKLKKGLRANKLISSDESEVSEPEPVRLRSRTSKSITEVVEQKTPEKSSLSASKADKKVARGTPRKISKDITPQKTAAAEKQEQFRPGWEDEVYEYKRSLKIPASLISVGRPSWHRKSTSLPDLDPHSSDASESFSEIRKIQQQQAEKSDASTSNETLPRKDSKRGRTIAKSKLAIEPKDAKCTSTIPKQPTEEPDCENKSKSIIDLLHQRVIRPMSKLNKKLRVINNEPKILPQSNEVELLQTPGPEGEKVFKPQSVFDTAVLKSRTRKEYRVQKNQEIIREVFGGEDRPASAPPLNFEGVAAQALAAQTKIVSTKPDVSSPPMTYDQKYKQYLEKMNVDFCVKSVIKTEPAALLDVHQIKQEKMDEDSLLNQDDETQDTEINECERNADDIKEEILDSNERDTPSVMSEQDGMTPSSFKSLHRGKKGRGNRGGRRKGSSGFDYIRKKKKPLPQLVNSDGTPVPVPKRRAAAINYLEEKDENDINREIRGWVLNKGVGESVLHKAARLGYIDVIAFGLERLEMNPDQKDNAGYTPLHEACSRGHIDIARLLLEYGANHSETATSGGIRPLHEAVENGYTEIVRLLLSYGADPLLATYSGQTPIMLAENDESMAAFLRNYLHDIQNTGPNKMPWKFKGSWDIYDPDECGYNVFDEVSTTQDDEVKPSKPKCTSPIDTGVSSTTSDTKPAEETVKPSKCDSNSNIMLETNVYKKPDDVKDTANIRTKYKNLSTCTVVLSNIDSAVATSATTSTKVGKGVNLTPILPPAATKDLPDTAEIIQFSDDDTDGELFEIEEATAPHVPLYHLRDEGSVKWALLSDLCYLLKVKSKDTLLKQICPSSPPSSGSNKELTRELKMSDFLEKATCLQLLCAGEKLNIRSSKVVLVKYNDSVKSLLGIKTVLMRL